jgi:hypothetical protein
VLKDIQLFEVSLVAIPANPQAKLTNVKSAVGDVELTPRTIELLLCDGGVPQRFAKALLSGGWRAAVGSDVAELDELVATVKAKTARLNSLLEPQMDSLAELKTAITEYQTTSTEALAQTAKDVKDLRTELDRAQAQSAGRHRHPARRGQRSRPRARGDRPVLQERRRQRVPRAEVDVVGDANRSERRLSCPAAGLGHDDAQAVGLLADQAAHAYWSGASWLMSSATPNVVDELKDENGQYLWRNSSSASEPPTLLGKNVEISEDMPSVSGNAYPVLFGDFPRGYIIVERPWLRMLRDPCSSKPSIIFYAYRRVGGGLADCDAIRALKIATS